MPRAFKNGLPKLEYYHLNGTLYTVDSTQVSLWSNLGMLLAEHNISVLALHKRLQENGVSVNLKSLYRLAGSQPLQKFDARIVKPICLVLGIGLSELFSLEKPELSLLKLDPVTQARITNLLDKNNQGTITKRERAELERLVDKAERISLHNARALAEYRRRRADRTEGTGMGLKHRPGKESEAARQLLCLRTRQKHAVVECMKEARFADPFLFFDQLGMHHCDLASRSAEADKA